MTVPRARFRTSRKKLGPRWLTGGEGELVGYSLDVLKDAFIERVRLGLMARLPQNDPTGTTTAPTDALEAMGHDRRVVRGIFETDAEYAARELLWLDDRKRAGNPFMLMQKLAEYTGPGPAFGCVDANGNWYTREADGTLTATLPGFAIQWSNVGWDWDGRPVGRRWARFWVIIRPNGLWEASPLLGDGPALGESEGTLGTTATPEQVARVKFIVNDWKRPGSRCVNIIIAFDEGTFLPGSSGGPDGLWERPWKVVDGVYVRSRLDTARYWAGR